MKVCGFSFIRNGLSLDYPFREAIQSILPICDAVIVAVGQSEDNTACETKNLDSKVKVINTVWDESLKLGGKVFAHETDKAFNAIPAEYDWAFYIQGDEVIHEQYLAVIKAAMEEYLDDSNVDGLLFNYLHFYGSYDFVGMKHSWYRREIRVVRNRKDIFSYKDAQGFRKKPNEKLKVKLIDAWVYHYGWVRNPIAMRQKELNKVNVYGGDEDDTQWLAAMDQFVYEQMNEPVKRFEGTHPAVMRERVARMNWQFNGDRSHQFFSFKDAFKRIMGQYTGWIPGEYRNYKLI